MARLGILGFPNVGKTTVFNALTGLSAPTARHPYSTHEPNLGVARVPDDRLEAAARVENSAKVVHATLELLDLPAMARPGHGSGLAATFLGKLRDMDALAIVVRGFSDPGVPDDESGTDAPSQAQELLLELALADSEVFERRRSRIEKEATADPALRPAALAVARAAEHLEQGFALRSRPWGEDERRAFQDMAPLTLKPAVWIVNVSEDDDTESAAAAVSAVVPSGDTVVALSARIEAEAAQLDPADRAELFEGLGLGEGALARTVHASYQALGVQSFYTLGPKEAHAWTVRVGATAPEAAGKIHSDLERGFIRAEVAGIDEVIAAGGWDAAKAAGFVRVEGKGYIVQEGDVILIRFSV